MAVELKCPMCGQVNPGEMSFCGKCGASLVGAAPVSTATATAVAASNASTRRPMATHTTWSIALGGAVAALLIGRMLYSAIDSDSTPAVKTMPVSARASATTLEITNDSGDELSHVEITIRPTPGGTAYRKTYDSIDPRRTFIAHLNDFADTQGRRWNPLELKIYSVDFSGSAGGEHAEAALTFPR